MILVPKTWTQCSKVSIGLQEEYQKIFKWLLSFIEYLLYIIQCSLRLLWYWCGITAWWRLQNYTSNTKKTKNISGCVFLNKICETSGELKAQFVTWLLFESNLERLPFCLWTLWEVPGIPNRNQDHSKGQTFHKPIKNEILKPGEWFMCIDSYFLATNFIHRAHLFQEALSASAVCLHYVFHPANRGLLALCHFCLLPHQAFLLATFWTTSYQKL